MNSAKHTSSRTGALALGIDFGTSGCRAVAIDGGGTVQAEAAIPLPPPRRDGARVEQAPALWLEALDRLLAALLRQVPPRRIAAIAVDGTSGTVLLADSAGAPLTPALMYNDNRARAEAAAIAAVAPRESAAHGTASGLAKLLWLLRHGQADGAARVLSQTDVINRQLLGRDCASDANNMLKLGYDPLRHNWPLWLDRLGVARRLLPDVVKPGTALGVVSAAIAQRYGLCSSTLVVAGTTDSTAAFIATGAHNPGDAVTSLGSTLVLKVISDLPVSAPEYGVYSQPLGSHWLVGGGSNSGGAVLRHYFSDAAMADLSERLQPERDTGLDYYPLPAPGERFPVNDPRLQPRLSPRPEDDAVFFQGLLEGIARIERDGYRRLAALGAPWPTSVRTVGGGAENVAWSTIRARLLGVPLAPSPHTAAAYGAALLAARAINATAAGASAPTAC